MLALAGDRFPLRLPQRRKLAVRRLHRRRPLSHRAEVLGLQLRYLSSSTGERHRCGGRRCWSRCGALSLPPQTLLRLRLHAPLLGLDLLRGGDGVLLGPALGLRRGLVTSFQHLE